MVFQKLAVLFSKLTGCEVCVLVLTWWPGPSSCARWSLWARCVAAPGALPPPCWGTRSRRCSRSPWPGAEPRLGDKAEGGRVLNYSIGGRKQPSSALRHSFKHLHLTVFPVVSSTSEELASYLPPGR